MQRRSSASRAPVPCALVTLLLTLPGVAGALEPRYDHRDQQGPTVEAYYARDVLWGTRSSGTAQRGAVRVAWSIDPTGDGNELFFGAAFTVHEGGGTARDRLKLVLDTRYRACVGTEEFKTLLEIGLWGSAAERVAVGPLVGLGFIYDFNRNFGLLTSGFLGAGIGERRVVSFGGGLGLQFRFE